MKHILNKIKEYNTIIIHRHNNPDVDALGSQFGLYHCLVNTFPNKNIYKVGDMNNFTFLGEMDVISDDVYKDSLVIICDVAVSKLISDDRYTLAKEVIVIDHHTNPTDIECYSHINSSYGAAAQLIADLLIEFNFDINKESATALYAGIISDTGRFMYSSTTSGTLSTAAKLIDLGADVNFVHDNLYTETIEQKQTKAYFAASFKLTKNNVAYMFNDKTIYDKFDLTPFTISRGMVNQMAGIKEVLIWANFTYNPETDLIMCEFRSRNVEIVHIAKKYGGGGHACACGASVKTFDEAQNILNDFDELLESVK